MLEEFRTPYQVSEAPAAPGIEQLRPSTGGPSLLWPSSSHDHALPVAAWLGTPESGGIPIFARMTPDRIAECLLAEHGGSWAPAQPLFGNGEERVASIWRGCDGSVFLPFDPDEVRLSYLTERYLETARGPRADSRRRLAMGCYYRLRGVLPRPVQIHLRRRYARLQARRTFPRWPIETALHDFDELFFAILESIAGEPVPRIAAWPNGHTWSLVLTHDVETDAGLRALDPVIELERSLGLRSSWNFVPRRYLVSTERIRELQADGFEVGVHGLYHDGRDLASPAVFLKRLPGMRDAADRWSAVGFRSPATHRQWDLMPLLGFDYDSSYPDTDPFEPQAGGCCSWLPFFNGEIVELPLTMPQDHTLFVILRQVDEHAWVTKAELLRDRGGMALIDTHPDYLVDDRILKAYAGFLERFVQDGSAWKALPCEVSSWWRLRAELCLERAGSRWKVIGPGAEQASVETISADAGKLEILGVADGAVA